MVRMVRMYRIAPPEQVVNDYADLIAYLDRHDFPGAQHVADPAGEHVAWFADAEHCVGVLIYHPTYTHDVAGEHVGWVAVYGNLAYDEIETATPDLHTYGPDVKEWAVALCRQAQAMC